MSKSMNDLFKVDQRFKKKKKKKKKGKVFGGSSDEKHIWAVWFSGDNLMQGHQV